MPGLAGLDLHEVQEWLQFACTPLKTPALRDFGAKLIPRRAAPPSGSTAYREAERSYGILRQDIMCCLPLTQKGYRKNVVVEVIDCGFAQWDRLGESALPAIDCAK